MWTHFQANQETNQVLESGDNQSKPESNRPRRQRSLSFYLWSLQKLKSQARPCLASLWHWAQDAGEGSNTPGFPTWLLGLRSPHILTYVHLCQGVLLQAQDISGRGQGLQGAGMAGAIGVTAVQVLVHIRGS